MKFEKFSTTSSYLHAFINSTKIYIFYYQKHNDSFYLCLENMIQHIKEVNVHTYLLLETYQNTVVVQSAHLPSCHHFCLRFPYYLKFSTVLVSDHLAVATNPPEFILTADKCGAQISVLQQLHGRPMSGGQQQFNKRKGTYNKNTNFPLFAYVGVGRLIHREYWVVQIVICL